MSGVRVKPRTRPLSQYPLLLAMRRKHKCPECHRPPKSAGRGAGSQAWPVCKLTSRCFGLAVLLGLPTTAGSGLLLYLLNVLRRSPIDHQVSQCTILCAGIRSAG